MFENFPSEYFFLPRLSCHHWGARPPLRRGVATGQKLEKSKKKKKKKKNKLLILSFTHTFVHTLLSAPEAVTPDRQWAT